MTDKKILFMGTPDFAAGALKYLYENGLNIIAVVTKPDVISGRGNKLCASAVKRYAESVSLPVLQPISLKDEAFLPTLNSLLPDMLVVVAYGKILPPYILDFPKYGCVNLHGSLLPKYRGAAPIQRAVLDGEKQSGLTTMLMDDGVDTGAMLLSESVEIGENETTDELYEKLTQIGGPLLLKTIKLLFENKLTPIAQNNSLATYAKKLTVEDEKIDFSQPAELVHNKIRGMSAFPGAYALKDGKKLKLSDSRVSDGEFEDTLAHGSIISISKEKCIIKCAEKSAVEIKKFKPEGKGFLTASDMLNGRKLNVGDILI